jgi:hypothetical protein
MFQMLIIIKPQDILDSLGRLPRLRSLKLRIQIARECVIAKPGYQSTLQLQEDETRLLIASLIRFFTIRPGNALELIKITFRIPFSGWRNGLQKWTVTTSLQGSGPPLFRFQKKLQPCRPIYTN